MLFYREVGDKDKGSLSLWIVAVCEKRLFRFILSIIIWNKSKLIHWYFYARSLLLESSLTVHDPISTLIRARILLTTSSVVSSVPAPSIQELPFQYGYYAHLLVLFSVYITYVIR